MKQTLVTKAGTDSKEKGMHDFIASSLVNEHRNELLRTAPHSARFGSAPQRRSARRPTDDGVVTIRYAGPADEPALERLARLDERSSRLVRPSRRRRGRKTRSLDGILVAEVGQDLAAALPLDGTPAFADPFVPSAGLVSLLEARAEQLHRAASGSRRGLRAAPQPSRAR